MTTGASSTGPSHDESSVGGAGRFLAEPGRFAHDDGTPDFRIREAADVHALLAALADGRVLVALVASPSEGDALAGEEKVSEMSVVSMVAGDGRKGLLVFSGTDTLRIWDPDARPVPVAGSDAARAALEQECEALIIDVAGPRRQILTETDVVALAGLDAREFAWSLAQRAMDAVLGTGRALVRVGNNGLLVHAPGMDPNLVAESVPSRVLAFTQVEIVDEWPVT